MAASSHTTFLWMLRKVDAALTTLLKVVRGEKDYPFLEKYLTKEVPKLNTTFLFNASPFDQILTT
jgi:spore cortex formation protein SpoVR/YcgB (stage V sporulation)